MGFKQTIEGHAVVWFLGAVVVAFGMGWKAYETVQRVSGQTTIAVAEKEGLDRSAARVKELEATLSTLKAREGKAPRRGDFVLTSNVNNSRPVDTLGAARMGSTPYLYVRWVGLTPGGLYTQHLELRDNLGRLAHENDFTIIAPESEQGVWHSVFFDPQFYSAGEYRVRYLMNGEEVLETGIVVEPQTP